MTNTKVLITLLALPTCLLTLQISNNEEQPNDKYQQKSPQSQIVEIVELLLGQRPYASDYRQDGMDFITKPNETPPEAEVYPKHVTFIKKNDPPEQEIRILYENYNNNDPEEDMMTLETRNSAIRYERKEEKTDVLPLSIENSGVNVDEQRNDRNQSSYKGQVASKQTTVSKSSVRPTEEIRPTYIEPEEVYKPIREPVKKPKFAIGETVVLTLSNQKQTSTEDRYIEPVYVDQTRPYEHSTRPVREDEYDRRRTNYESSFVERPSKEPTRLSYSEEYEKPARRETIQERPRYETRPVEYERPYQETSAGRPAYDDTRKERDQVRPLSKDTRPKYEDDGSSGYNGFPESHFNNQQFATPLQNNIRNTFPASPCTHVFKYEGREPERDKWYGDILVTTDQTLVGMRLDIALDRPAELLANWEAAVKSRDNIHFTILSLTKTLVPGPAESVRILVRFKKDKAVPYLQSISLNGRRICPASKPTATGLQSSNTRPASPPRRPPYETQSSNKRTTEYYVEETTRRTPPPPQIPQYYEEDRRTTRPNDYYENNRRTNEYYNNERRTTSVDNYYNSNQETTRTTQRTTTIYRPEVNPDYYEEERPKPNNKPSNTNSRPQPTTISRPTQTQSSSKPVQNSRPQSSSSSSSSSSSTSNNNKPTNSGSSSSAKPNTSVSKFPSSGNSSSRPLSAGGGRPAQCGKASVQPRPLITHGQMTSRGQWPWHTAIYKNEGINLNYICGGSLITNNIVLTAAHCVTHRISTRPVEPNILVVYLGKYHLKLWSEGGVKDKQVSEIHVHPEYNSTSFRSDLAVLILSSPVEFSDFIKPVCLWDRKKVDISYVLNKEGTVVGWGYDETQSLTQELMQAAMPVVSQEVCLRSFPNFFPYFTSNMTYCAGFKNGTSVCNGDSGGGMVFPISTNNEERWYLRGLVSISVSEKDLRVCDTKHYVVFTDLAKYLDWIDNFL